MCEVRTSDREVGPKYRDSPLNPNVNVPIHMVNSRIKDLQNKQCAPKASINSSSSLDVRVLGPVPLGGTGEFGIEAMAGDPVRRG